MDTHQPPNAAEVRVELLGIQPAIWRRLLVPVRFDLGQLHQVIQAAFGWEDSHLHEFRVGGLRYRHPEQFDDTATDDDARRFDETEVRLLDFHRRAKVSFIYVYDFGDHWEHEVTVERFIAVTPEPLAAACLAGERAGPPEDVGGASGYDEFLEALGDAQHPAHVEMRRWAGRGFNPERFSLARTDKAVRAALRANLRT